MKILNLDGYIVNLKKMKAKDITKEMKEANLEKVQLQQMSTKNYMDINKNLRLSINSKILP